MIVLVVRAVGDEEEEKQTWRNKIVGVFVVGNPVCFAKSIVAGPVFGFPANFHKYREWALERQRSKIGETKLLGFSSWEILYVLQRASFRISANFSKYTE